MLFNSSILGVSCYLELGCLGLKRQRVSMNCSWKLSASSGIFIEVLKLSNESLRGPKRIVRLLLTRNPFLQMLFTFQETCIDSPAMPPKASRADLAGLGKTSVVFLSVLYLMSVS